jgi:hypothetical protein
MIHMEIHGVSNPFGLSLSKPCCHMHQPFDKLRANRSGQ